MISPECLAREWVLQKAAEIGCQYPVMLEKTTVALQLLGHLAESGLAFQFNGGSSLLLRLNSIRRLSIDVDIVTQAKPEELHAVLGRISKLSASTPAAVTSALRAAHLRGRRFHGRTTALAVGPA